MNKFGEPWELVSWFGGHVVEGEAPASASRKLYRGNIYYGSLEGFAEPDAKYVLGALNSLAGIDDPEKWVKAHRDLIDAVEDLKQWGPTIEGINRLDKALAACEAAEGRKV